MPRIRKYGASAEQIALEEELRSRYGGSMTLTDLCTELGVKSTKTGRAWVSGMKAMNVNGKLRYRCADIAERMAAQMVTAP